MRRVFLLLLMPLLGVAQAVHPLARPEFAGGRVDPSLALNRMILVLATAPDKDAELRAFVDRLHTPGSSDFHHWLTPQQFGQRFGADPKDIQAVENWLLKQGFRVDSIAQGARILQFSGTVAQVEQAFATEMRHYNVGGRDHIANAKPIAIPSEIAAMVKALVPLNDFFSHPLVRAKPQDTTSGGNALSPGDFAAIYNLNPLFQANLNGAGQRIALIERSNVLPADFTSFRTIFGLSTSAPNIVLSGPDPGVLTSTDAFEATADLQSAASAAPGATLDMIVAGSTAVTDGIILSAYDAIELNQDSVMSISYGECEQQLSTENVFWASLFLEAAAQGISVIVGTGDTGAAGCDNFDPPNSVATQGQGINGIASTPFDTAVGGSEFDESAAGGNAVFWNPTDGPNYTSVIGYIPEMVWNESCNGSVEGGPCPGNGNLSASGGGASFLYNKPSWQALSVEGIPQDGSRDVPDVSLTSAYHDGREICFQQGCQNTSSPSFEIGYGTSLSAPSFAGIMAVINQKSGGRQGLANYALYALAATENFSKCTSSSRTDPTAAASAQCPFNDITTGNNSVPGQSGFNAGPGYDLATGIGSVNASVLATTWSTFGAGLRPTATTLYTGSASINIIHGQSVLINATVRPQSGSGTPTGPLSLGTSTGLSGFQYGVLSAAGSVTGTTTALPGGSYNLFAAYAGDSNFAGSVSNSIPATVSPESSTTTMGIAKVTVWPPAVYVGSSLPSTVSLPYGSPAVVVAEVAGLSGAGTPTGNLSFTYNNQTISIPLNSLGDAEAQWCFTLATCGGVGSYQFIASYPGDASFGPNTSRNTVVLTVTKATPSINWPNPADIVTGTPLGSAQLNAAAAIMAGVPAAPLPVPGAFTYSPPAGTVLALGKQTITVQFTPSDTGTFNSATAQVTINVVAAPPLTIASAAAGVSALAPGSLASAFGSALTSGTPQTASLPWPASLGGTSVQIIDSTGATTPALLTYASASQVNFQIPDTVAKGQATIKVIVSGGGTFSAQANLVPLAPGILTLNAANLVAATADCVSSSGTQTPEPVYQVVNGAVVALPLNLGPCMETVLIMYGTGFDQATVGETQVTVGGVAAVVEYAGPQSQYPGLDQINLVIPNSLAGQGNVPIVLTIGGIAANTANLTFQ